MTFSLITLILNPFPPRQKFQALETSRILFVKDGMGTFSLLESRVPAKVKAGCDRMNSVGAQLPLFYPIFLIEVSCCSSLRISRWKRKSVSLLARM